MRAKLRFLCGALAAAAGLSACHHYPAQRATQPSDTTVYVIERGWHTDIALSVRDTKGPLGSLQRSFPGVNYLSFGFGDKAYVLSRRSTFFDMLLAMLPGRAAILVTALRASPSEAFGNTDVVAIGVTSAGARRITRFLWDYFDKDRNGGPRRIADGPYLGSVYYASTGTYSAFHTCNTWVAEGLHTAGMPIQVTGIILADQLMSEARRVAPLQPGTSRDRAAAD